MLFLDPDLQPVREAVSYRELFTVGWFGVREKHCSRLKIYNRLRASEQALQELPTDAQCNILLLGPAHWG